MELGIIDIYGSSGIITEIKVTKLRWTEHIERMNDSEIVRGIMDNKPEERRKIGRPNMDG